MNKAHKNRIAQEANPVSEQPIVPEVVEKVEEVVEKVVEKVEEVVEKVVKKTKRTKKKDPVDDTSGE